MLNEAKESLQRAYIGVLAVVLTLRILSSEVDTGLERRRAIKSESRGFEDQCDEKSGESGEASERRAHLIRHVVRDFASVSMSGRASRG